MKIKLKNKICKNCMYKKIATQIIEMDKKSAHNETPLPKIPEPTMIVETFSSLEEVPASKKDDEK